VIFFTMCRDIWSSCSFVSAQAPRPLDVRAGREDQVERREMLAQLEYLLDVREWAAVHNGLDADIDRILDQAVVIVPVSRGIPATRDTGRCGSSGARAQA